MPDPTITERDREMAREFCHDWEHTNVDAVARALAQAREEGRREVVESNRAYVMTSFGFAEDRERKRRHYAEALEKAAEVCEEYAEAGSPDAFDAAEDCAARIRKLKEEK